MDGEKTDEVIAEEVQHGNIESFGLLVERYENKISRYIFRSSMDTEDTKDLTQEVFLKAYVNIQSFDTSRKFSPWIYRIAHNEFVNAAKKKWRERMILMDFDLLFPHPVAKETSDSDAEKKELRRILENYLGQLSPKYREPLALYYFDDMDYREIAEILEIPTSTVGVRLQRGRNILKTMVSKKHNI